MTCVVVQNKTADHGVGGNNGCSNELVDIMGWVRTAPRMARPSCHWHFKRSGLEKVLLVVENQFMK